MLSIAVSIRNAQAQVVATAAANGSIVIKSGTGQTLSTIPLGATPFSAPSNGAVALAAPVFGPVSASGTATYFELYSSTSSLILSGTCSVSSGDLVLTDVAMLVGDTVNIDTFAYVAPEA